MTARYRKKPGTTVEAVQFRAGEQDSAFALDVMEGVVRYPEDGTMLIKTPEGEMCAQPGDWIIRGVKGELYPCKPDIFAATYEPDTEPSERDRLTAENAALREALGKYGDHTTDCSYQLVGHDSCTCGLDAALRRSKGETDGR